MKTHILVVEDETDIANLIKHSLERAPDFVVTVATTGDAAMQALTDNPPDLLVLDLNLPVISGTDICRRVRGSARTAQLPIIMLTARTDEADRVAGLDLGADDYVTKPFSTAEFQARVRAQLRRAGPREQDSSGPMDVDGLSIDLPRRRLERDGVSIHLTPTEWDLLRVLVRNAGRTLTHGHIFREVWGSSSPGGDPQAYLRVHVANLRRKTERDPLRPRIITTEPGVGYRFHPLD